MNDSIENMNKIQWIDGFDKKSISKQINEQESILRGIEDSVNGRVISHSYIRIRYEKWL